MKSQSKNRTIYGVIGLDNAREIFGEVRLAKDGIYYHPSEGTEFCDKTPFLVIKEPPFFKKTDGEFDEYYSGKNGWE